MDNLLANLPIRNGDETFTNILKGHDFRLERIVSHGHSTPADTWYDQATAEWVIVLAGAATLRIEEPPQVLELRPGDFLNIPAHQRHRVDWTDPDNPTVWLAVHYQSEV